VLIYIHDMFFLSDEQSRLYLGLGRDGLLPAIFAKVHPKCHTPLHSQIWVGCVASIMAGLLNVRMLSHILSVGTLVRIDF
jgi:basic amino acid/polyamine antiporter, APA family